MTKKCLISRVCYGAAVLMLLSCGGALVVGVFETRARKDESPGQLKAEAAQDTDRKSTSDELEPAPSGSGPDPEIQFEGSNSTAPEMPKKKAELGIGAALFGFFCFGVPPAFALVVLGFLLGRSDARDRAGASQQSLRNRFLGMMRAHRTLEIGEAAQELSITEPEVKDLVYAMARAGEFKGQIDDDLIIAGSAGGAAPQSTTKPCPGCGADVTMWGQLVRCEYCGTEVSPDEVAQVREPAGSESAQGGSPRTGNQATQPHRLEVKIRSHGCALYIVHLCSLGISVVALFLYRRNWPRYIDTSGMTLRNGTHVPWSEFKSARRVQVLNRGHVVAERIDLGWSKRTIRLNLFEIYDSDTVAQFILAHVPDHAKLE